MIHNPDHLESPGAGYRFLESGEIIEPDDETWLPGRPGGYWLKTGNAGLQPGGFCTYRRKITSTIAISADGIPIST